MPSPSTVTCRSSMASSSAAWVFGGVRLISSASRRLVNTGPSRKRKEPSLCWKIIWPSTSEGIRSGVNWTRLKFRSRVRARVLTSSVLATPGTPSSSTWPRTSRAATRPETAPSWPTTALATSWRTRSTAVRGPAWPDPLCGGGDPPLLPGSVGTGDLRTDGVYGLGERDQLGVVSWGGRLEGGQHALTVDPGSDGDRPGHLLRRRAGRQPEPLGQRTAQVAGEQGRRLSAVAS